MCTLMFHKTNIILIAQIVRSQSSNHSLKVNIPNKFKSLLINLQNNPIIHILKVFSKLSFHNFEIKVDYKL
jgi:hypothetical protein